MATENELKLLKIFEQYKEEGVIDFKITMDFIENIDKDKLIGELVWALEMMRDGKCTLKTPKQVLG